MSTGEAMLPTMPACVTVRMRHDALLTQKGKQLVQLRGEEFLLGHGVQIAVEAVDNDHLRALAGGIRAFGGASHDRGELAGRQLGGIDLLDRDETILRAAFRSRARACETGSGTCRCFRRTRTSPPARHARRRRPRTGWPPWICRCRPVPAATCSCRWAGRRPEVHPVAHCRSGRFSSTNSATCSDGHETGKNVEAAAANREIVIAAAKRHTAHLGHADAGVVPRRTGWPIARAAPRRGQCSAGDRLRCRRCGHPASTPCTRGRQSSASARAPGGDSAARSGRSAGVPRANR